jgi:hypothetical protein
MVRETMAITAGASKTDGAPLRRGPSPAQDCENRMPAHPSALPWNPRFHRERWTVRDEGVRQNGSGG